ncbi:MAG: hypothetical protein CMG61_05110 [Candidatus Marinimicrobia bacterium]|nr:hypothetical protein [Candidatus Neomarinimicrobiota bacterium]
MNKKLTLLLFSIFSILLFSQDIEIMDAEKIKNMKPRAKKRLLGKNLVIKQDPYNIDEINQLKILYEFGNQSALNVMLNIFSDKNQTYEIRLLCLDLLSSIDNPLVKDALKNTVENVEFLEIEYLVKCIEILNSFEDLESTNSLVNSLKNSENKIMDLRETIVNAIGENGSDDEILTLIDLYEISLTNHNRMNEILTLTLGNMNDDKSIPLLMKIANDENINIRIRNTAVEVLSRKNAPELVDFFIEMLGDPETNEEMLNFVNSAMGNIQNERMTMALLESFQTGKNRYYANLHSIMSAMDNYNNPQIKPAFIEVATTDGFPRLLRIKAINSLANFNDSRVLEYIIPILENPENYEFYFEILNLAKKLDAKEKYMNEIRNAAFKAMLSTNITKGDKIE